MGGHNGEGRQVDEKKREIPLRRALRASSASTSAARWREQKTCEPERKTAREISTQGDRQTARVQEKEQEKKKRVREKEK